MTHLMKRRRVTSPSFECSAAEWSSLCKESSFGQHFYAENCKHSIYKHVVLEGWLHGWINDRPSAGGSNFHMFDLFAGNGGYWEPEEGGGGGVARAGAAAVCTHLGTTATLCSAAVRQKKVPLRNVWAAEKVTSFHSVLQRVLLHLLCDSISTSPGPPQLPQPPPESPPPPHHHEREQPLPTPVPDPPEQSAAAWVESNVRCGPWGKELLPKIKEAGADADAELLVIADQFGYSEFNRKIISSLLRMPAGRNPRRRSREFAREHRWGALGPSEGGRGTPSVFSWGGPRLLPSVYADARCIDAAVVSKATTHILMLVGLTRVDPLTLCKTFGIPCGKAGAGCIPPERVGVHVPSHRPMTVADMGGTEEGELRHQLWWLDAVNKAVQQMGGSDDSAGGCVHTAKALVFREQGAERGRRGDSRSSGDGGSSSAAAATAPAAKLLYALLFVSRDEAAAARMDTTFRKHANADARPEVLLEKYGTCNIFSPTA